MKPNVLQRRQATRKKGEFSKENLVNDRNPNATLNSAPTSAELLTTAARPLETSNASTATTSLTTTSATMTTTSLKCITTTTTTTISTKSNDPLNLWTATAIPKLKKTNTMINTPTTTTLSNATMTPKKFLPKLKNSQSTNSDRTTLASTTLPTTTLPTTIKTSSTTIKTSSTTTTTSPTTTSPTTTTTMMMPRFHDSNETNQSKNKNFNFDNNLDDDNDDDNCDDGDGNAFFQCRIGNLSQKCFQRFRNKNMTTLNKIKYDSQLLLHYLYDGHVNADKTPNIVRVCKVKVTRSWGTLLTHYYADIALSTGYVFEFHPGSQPRTFQQVHSVGHLIMVIVLCDECCKRELCAFVEGENNFNVAFRNCESILCKRKSMQTVFVGMALTVIALNMFHFSWYYIFFVFFIIALLYVNNNYIISGPQVAFCQHQFNFQNLTRSSRSCNASASAVNKNERSTTKTNNVVVVDLFDESGHRIDGCFAPPR
ncbi:ac81 [Lambdina fiscellaria nucleopolyhedrovirus]|uniref:Ac81 n=1 Tax=Lambdina fiscellaria nucleopolyhedrovirus TaxID=1642929 RepID=A0A0E3Z613_9ABAC|nr:ac81 [Lambdina fiscellaria nucleopolyhedrovirus]AKC91691.1 ac81 [Lambdina fiscellaria nucleopolyhedrovirus]